MIKKVPDLTSYRLDEAENFFKKNGINYSLKKTAPVFQEKHHQNEESFRQCRVLKQIEHKSMIEIIFAEEAC